ncbi:MAG: pitrilysin family protein [Candidatus Omnitrophota bacterium]
MSKKFINLLVILLVAASCQNTNQSNSKPIINKETNLTRHTLENGLVVLIKEVTTSPLISLEAKIKAGSATEGEFLGSGISHFIEHMLFKGTSKRPVGKIAREIKSYGGEISASTTYDYTSFRITLPNENLAPALEVLSDCLMNPAFDKAELEKEREVIIKEIMLNDDRPGSRLWKLLFLNAYTTHPYRHPIIGYEALFRKLTRDDLIAYHHKMYVPNNITLAIVGGINSQDALRQANAAFGQFKMGALISPAYIKEPVQISEREIREEAEISLSYIALGYHSVSINSHDLFALDVLANILGQGESSRLTEEIKNKSKLVYSIEALNYTPKDPGLFIVQCTTKETEKEKIVKAIFNEIKKFKSGKIKNRELEKAKKSVISDYLFGQELVESQAEDLTSNQIFTADPNFSLKYIEGISRVGKNDVVRVAKAYLTRDNMTVACLFPKKVRDDDKPKTNAPEPKIMKYTLSNGLRVLLYQNNNLPIASIKAVFEGGLRTETGATNGTSKILSDMLTKGTKTKTVSKIREIIESRGGSISNFSANNSIGLDVELLSQDIDFGLSLLSDILFNPTLPQKELTREKELMLAALKAQKDDIFTQGVLLTKKTLYSQHPYGLNPLGSENSINKISRKQLFETYHKYVQPKNMVLCVFGDLPNQEALLKKIKALFGKMKNRLPPVIKPAPEPPLKEIKSVSERLNKEQSLVILAWPTTTLFDADKFPLELISAILSNQDGRLFKTIRDQLGLAYALGAASQLGLDKGYFLIYAACSAKDLDIVKNIILKEAEDLKARPISVEELNRLKAGLLTEDKASQEKNADLALRTGLDELYGLGYDNYKQYEAKIKSVTQEDLMNVAKKYLSDSAYVACVINPKSPTR